MVTGIGASRKWCHPLHGLKEGRERLPESAMSWSSLERCPTRKDQWPYVKDGSRCTAEPGKREEGGWSGVGRSSLPEVLPPLTLWSSASACHWPNLMETRGQVSWNDVIHRGQPPREQNGTEWRVGLQILSRNKQPTGLPCSGMAMLWPSLLWWLDPVREQWRESIDWMTLICLYSHISQHVSSPESTMFTLNFFRNHMFRALRKPKATSNGILSQGSRYKDGRRVCGTLGNCHGRSSLFMCRREESCLCFVGHIHCQMCGLTTECT